MKVKDLPTNPKSGVVLHCPFCNTTFSALRDDYILHPPNEALMHCSTPMALVHRVTTYTPLAPKEAEEDHGTAN